MSKFSKVHASAASDSDPIGFGTDVIASDFTVVRADSLVHLTMATDTTAIYALVGSDGASLYLNNGSNITANAVHYETFQLDTARTWNLQLVSSGSATWKLLMIVEMSES